MSKDIVINQHYISRCILKHFAEQNKVYETLVDDKKIYRTNYNNSMSERYTYEHPLLETNQIEKSFCEIEKNFSKTIEQIIETIIGLKNGQDKFSHVKNLVGSNMSNFLVFYYRSKALLTELEFDKDEFTNRIIHMLRKILDSEYIKNLGYSIINYYDFAVIESGNSNFILSDQYVSTVALAIKNRFFEVSNRQMGMKDVLILIPISAKFYAVFFNGRIPYYIARNKINLLNDEQVDEVNRAIINNSYTKCVAQNREPLERAASEFIYHSPTRAMAGGNGIVSGATIKKEVFFYKVDEKAFELFCSMDWTAYKGLGRNDFCGCNSGKNFKHCCLEAYNTCIRMYSDIESKKNYYLVNYNAVVEDSIFKFIAPDC